MRSKTKISMITLVSSDQNFIYLVLSDKINNITFLSYEITDKRQPMLLFQKDLGITGYPLLEISYNKTEVYVSIDEFGSAQ